MTFLKKLGSILANVVGVASGIGPIASALFPQHAGTITKGLGFLEQLAGVIIQVEVVGQALSLPGAQKLTAAAPQVAQLVLQSDLMVGKKIDSPELFKAGCTKIADGMADVLNSLEDKIEVEKL